MKQFYLFLLGFITFLLSSNALQETGNTTQQKRKIGQEEAEAKLSMHLRNALGSNFTKWLRENNYEPSVPNNLEYAFTLQQEQLFDIDFGINGEQFVGFTNKENGIQVEDATVYLYETGGADISLQFVNVGPIGSITIQGNYTANGTLADGSTLSSAGRWNITGLSFLIPNGLFPVNSISWNGYMYMGAEYSGGMFLGIPLGLDMYLENFLDDGENGYASKIKKALANHLETLYQSNQQALWYPVGVNIHSFLTNLFANVSIGEVLGSDCCAICNSG